MLNLITIFISFIFFVIGVYNIKDRLNCNKSEKGKFIEPVIALGRGHMQYKAKFEFEFNGQVYTGISLNTFSSKELNRIFKEGSCYPVKVNTNKPTRFTCGGCLPFTFNDLFLICVFGFITVMGSINILLSLV